MNIQQPTDATIRTFYNCDDVTWLCYAAMAFVDTSNSSQWNIQMFAAILIHFNILNTIPFDRLINSKAFLNTKLTSNSNTHKMPTFNFYVKKLKCFSMAHHKCPSDRFITGRTCVGFVSNAFDLVWFKFDSEKFVRLLLYYKIHKIWFEKSVEWFILGLKIYCWWHSIKYQKQTKGIIRMRRNDGIGGVNRKWAHHNMVLTDTMRDRARARSFQMLCVLRSVTRFLIMQ